MVLRAEPELCQLLPLKERLHVKLWIFAVYRLAYRRQHILKIKLVLELLDVGRTGPNKQDVMRVVDGVLSHLSELFQVRAVDLLETNLPRARG